MSDTFWTSLQARSSLQAPNHLCMLQPCSALRTDPAIFTAGCRSTWQLEGQVTGASDNNMDMGRKTHGGQEWDYVFDVDVEEGQPPLKMPCNKDENPYAVAERYVGSWLL